MRTWIGIRLRNRIFKDNTQIGEVLFYNEKIVLRIQTGKSIQIVAESTNRSEIVGWLNENVPGWYQLRSRE